jgi:hypothetical protein
MISGTVAFEALLDSAPLQLRTGTTSKCETLIFQDLSS